jgi:hypothetical protein
MELIHNTFVNTINCIPGYKFLIQIYTFSLFRMSDAQELALPPAEGIDLTDKNAVDLIAAADGAETPVSVPAADGAETPVSVPATDGAETPKSVSDTPDGAGTKPSEKPWWNNIFPGGKRKSKKQSRKQKGGKKSKSRGGNKKSRKQRRSAKNKRA